ncbi:riboflavin biosynthesis protein RibF [Lentilactobacillus parakefiri]|uniref:Riboflavin biosynthesis protein n=1 Tax=Lentilactobacillus parakefiri TaxID=152332 RepID=A0A269XWM9_9LACO|nr:riboflavin biosynthesis protein RibF [Lentilactobacillus parakefiri]PAK77694.1 riboflavin biosynthesis protein RibF [Lentilactobacillus parakefiri]
MKISRLHYPLPDDFEIGGPTVVAMGFFDGFHKGHQAVLQRAKTEAEKRGAKLAVLTYDHHPAIVYRKMSPHEQRYLTLNDYKMRLLADFGVKQVFLVNYSYNFQSQTPEDFINNFLKRFKAVAVVAGFDHTYGNKNIATMANFPKFVKGAFDVITVPSVNLDDKKVSSTRIRIELDSGDVDGVNKLLGRPFQTRGVIVHGEERGRLLGYPTANVEHSEYQWLPAIGIYVVTVEIVGKKYLGMASIGKNVTFSDVHPMTVEINLMDFDSNIYGEVVNVNWLSYLRNEIKFQTPADLIDQLDQDKTATREYLQRHPEIMD